jgi:hypothetical protein
MIKRGSPRAPVSHSSFFNSQTYKQLQDAKKPAVVKKPLDLKAKTMVATQALAQSTKAEAGIRIDLSSALQNDPFELPSTSRVALTALKP